MLNLNKREIPHVLFERDLPGYLSGKDKAFLRVNARAAGAVNVEYMAKAEELILRSQIMDKKIGRIEDDEKSVRENSKNVRKVSLERIAILYDACVSDWETNILSDGEIIEPTRENFLALAEVRVPEIAAAIVDLEAECFEAAEDVEAATGEAEKN